MKTGERARKETRLVARTSVEVQEIIQKAADFSGATVSQFLIEAAMERAARVIEQTHTLRLTLQGAEDVIAALEGSPEINKNLENAARRYFEATNENSDRGSSKAP